MHGWRAEIKDKFGANVWRVIDHDKWGLVWDQRRHGDSERSRRISAASARADERIYHRMRANRGSCQTMTDGGRGSAYGFYDNGGSTGE